MIMKNIVSRDNLARKNKGIQYSTKPYPSEKYFINLSIFLGWTEMKRSFFGFEDEPKA